MQSSMLAALAAWLVVGTAFAADADQKAREEMQKRLNNEVMSSAFDPGDAVKAEAYAEEAQKRNVQPVAQPPAYWAPGWTCANLTTYAYYNYGDYRNCIYYHRYYGYYWRYRR